MTANKSINIISCDYFCLGHNSIFAFKHDKQKLLKLNNEDNKI
jgi:hypothetical protein